MFAIFVATLLVVGLLLPWENSCRPWRALDPDSSPSLVASEDFRALAQLEGRIELADRSSQLPLHLTQIDQVSKPSATGGQQWIVTFTSPCAELTIELHVDEVLTTHSIALNKIFLHEEGLECRCKQLDDLSGLLKHHFECNHFDIECDRRDEPEGKRPYATIHVDGIKLELDGNPEKIRRGRFSKETKFVC
jgi:hypothetical protein